MLNAQLEFSNTNTKAKESAPVIFFHENLNPYSRLIHEKALARAQRYLIAEADLLDSIIEVDRNRIFEQWGLTHLTPYCVKHLGLSEEVAATFVRVARKSLQVPELKEAISEGKLSVTKAKTIASVLTAENHQAWIEKAQSLSKDKLEREIASASPQAVKPEKAKVKGPNRVRVEFEISEEDMVFFRRAQDIVSRQLKKSANLPETQAKLLECFLDKFDPLRKADRVRAKAAKALAKARKTQNAHDKNQKNQKAAVRGDQTQKAKETEQNTLRNQQKTKSKRSQERPALKKPRPKLKAELIHAVNQRDRACCQARLPDGSLCGQSRWVHFHHVIAVAEGGTDAVENLITLCASHHRLWHS